MSSITLTIVVLIGLVLKLATTPEVRAAHIVFGQKEIDTSPTPPFIRDIYRHDANREICNNYFYWALVIRCTFAGCVLATVGALLIGLLAKGLGETAEKSADAAFVDVPSGAMDEVAWPALVVSTDGNEARFAKIVSERSYVAIIAEQDIQSFARIDEGQTNFFVLRADGELLIIQGAIRGVQILLFVGVLCGLICWLLAGKFRAVREATSEVRRLSKSSEDFERPADGER